MKKIPVIVLILPIALCLLACAGNESDKSSEIPGRAVAASDDPMQNKGIGPVTELALGELNEDMAAEGKVIYEQLCTACHKTNEKFIGPAPAGILERRSPEWVMNMILNPEEMVQKDPIAKKLLIEYNLSPMANQNLTEDQARKVLEYFRTL